MKENAKIEQQLLEEQLQAVTGGCGDCVNDSLMASVHLKEAGQLQQQALAESLNNISTPEQRMTKVNQAQNLRQQAANLLAGVAQREQDPNHWTGVHPRP